MKIIFSRKGFDSTAGGFPSLIFPDGTLFSIPIPSTKDDCFYSQLSFEYEGDSIQSILNEVTGKRIVQKNHGSICDFSLNEQRCHHDPMLVQQENLFLLGQTGKPQIHLQNKGIGMGSIFLFYGWFRHVEKTAGHWRYLPNSRDIHLIWGWMKVDRILDLGTKEQRDDAKVNYPILSIHPHMADWRTSPNRIYMSDRGGLLPYADARCLTDCLEYHGRSTWRLPVCFNQPQAFSFLKNFMPDGKDVIISYRGYGQEFVLDLEKVTSHDARSGIQSYMVQNIADTLSN